MILFKVDCPYEYEKQQTKKIYQQANQDQMREEIDLNCDEMLKDQNTSDSQEIVKEKIETTSEKNIPVRKVARSGKKQPLRINSKCTMKIRNNKRAWWDYIKNKENTDL